MSKDKEGTWTRVRPKAKGNSIKTEAWPEVIREEMAALTSHTVIYMITKVPTRWPAWRQANLSKSKHTAKQISLPPRGTCLTPPCFLLTGSSFLIKSPTVL